MRIDVKAVSAAVAATVLTGTMVASAVAAPLPTPPKPKSSKTVPASLFGMHDHALSTTGAGTGVRFGGVRIWDNGVRWDEVNTAPGVYNWDLLNTVVANAQATGAKDIMYVLGYSPNWAAEIVKPPCAPGKYADCSYFPGGSGSAPKNIEDWKTWVAAVANEYKGRITQYQIWNEANLSSFFETPGRDSAAVMAELTVAAEDVIGAIDPQAKVITASSTIVQKKSFVKSGWLTRYLTELKKLGGDPDGIAIHAYPWVNQGPGNGTLADRAKGVDLAMQSIARAGYKGKPVLDTEMNYGNQRNNGWPKKKYSQDAGAAYLAQTYLNSLHNGVVQVDWYGWDDFGLGIWPTSPSGQILKPGVAYQTLLTQVSGTKNKGCSVSKAVTVCLTTKGSARNYWAYRPTDKKVTYEVPAAFKVKQECDLTNRCKPIRKAKVSVGLSPILLKK